MGQRETCMGLLMERSIQREERKRRVRACMITFFCALLLGTGGGYYWAKQAYTRTYELRLEQKEILINHYQNHWTPIREVPVRARAK